MISDTEEEQFLCFQYMCFPWRRAGDTGPFMRCRRGSDCRGLQAEEGEWDCWRHSDRRNVHTGICLEKRSVGSLHVHQLVSGLRGYWLFCTNCAVAAVCKVPSFVKLCNNCRETVPCYYHSDCEDDLRCVVGHCGDPEYFRALAEMPCTEVRLQQE